MVRITIIDQWPAHVEVMKNKGLDITMPDLHLKIPVTAWQYYELADTCPIRIVFLAVKSYDTAWLTQLIEPSQGGWCPNRSPEWHEQRDHI